MDSSGHMTMLKLLNEEILEVPTLFSHNFVLPVLSLEDSATQVSTPQKTNMAMKHPGFEDVFSYWKWTFAIAMLGFGTWKPDSSSHVGSHFPWRSDIFQSRADASRVSMLTTKLGISELDGMENWEILWTYGSIAGRK